MESLTAMPRYEAYMDSGVRWLGEIPSHWKVERSQWLFSLRRERARKNDQQLTASQKHGMISQAEFMAIEGRRVTQVEFNPEILKHVEADDFIISMRSFQGGIEYCNVSGCVSSAYVPLIPRKYVNSKYFKYLLKSARYIEALQSTSNLVRDGQALRYENFRMVALPIVPFEEQEAIAGFLDKKTAQIDEAISIKEKQIELLKERKQIIIQKVVTQGLDPNVPMKDSGVDWIGEIPEHWEVVSIKHVADVRDGTHDTPMYVEETNCSRFLVTSKDFIGTDISFVGAKSISLKDHVEICKRSKVDPGDVLMSMIGGNIGKSVIVHDFSDFSIKNVALFKTRGENTISRFIQYYLLSGLLDKQLLIKSKGGAQPFLSLTDTRNLIFFKIDAVERRDIVDFLDIKTRDIVLSIGLIEKQIMKLKEYKTTLINSAVTGKIKVSSSFC